MDIDTTPYIERRKIWDSKPHIRLVYERWIERIRPFIINGCHIEIGSGSGLLRNLLPDVFLSDVTPLLWNDLAADCMNLPFKTGMVDCVFVFDMLHHAPDPHHFLEEAGRVLKPGGRVLLIEPYITPLSKIGYSLMHHEDVYFEDYHVRGEDGNVRNPWQGNLALPNLVFDRDFERWPNLHPTLNICHFERFGLLDFQLAAGFKPYAFVPYWLMKRVVVLDDWLLWAMKFIAFRIFIVLEKST